ncbi:MAG: hypothetical protein L7F77_15625 [Candidatus Magnetominusculus sp. LBB02]|nr:hypothetical protein [Candidatus Magnetominusculus sp. LBB02]
MEVENKSGKKDNDITATLKRWDGSSPVFNDDDIKHFPIRRSSESALDMVSPKRSKY